MADDTGWISTNKTESVVPTATPTTAPSTAPTTAPSTAPSAAPTAAPQTTNPPYSGGGTGGSTWGGSGTSGSGGSLPNTGSVIGGSTSSSSVTVVAGAGNGNITVANGSFAANVNGTDAAVDKAKIKVPFEAKTGDDLTLYVVKDANGNVVPRSLYKNGYMNAAADSFVGNYTIAKNAVSFDDVWAPWSVEAINALAAREIINGVNATSFDPDANVTRAQFAKMVVTMYDLDITGSVDLWDVDADAWYAPYVATAMSYGIVTGYDDGSFRPDALISRQEMSVMLYRATKNLGIGLLASGDKTPFADDAQIQDWAKEAVYEMKAAGIIQGVGDNMFKPEDNASRAQAAVAIWNMFKVSMSW